MIFNCVILGFEKSLYVFFKLPLFCYNKLTKLPLFCYKILSKLPLFCYNNVIYLPLFCYKNISKIRFKYLIICRLNEICLID